MQVAYCLSGHLRNYKHNNFFENMVHEVPGDVFIHTWDQLTQGISLDVSEMVAFYRPTGFKVENQDLFKLQHHLSDYNVDIQNHICMWHSKSSVIKLANDYDVIVSFRPDLMVQSKLNKEEIFKVYNDKYLLTVGASDDCYKSGILTDNFAFGSSLAMTEYSKYSSVCVPYRNRNHSSERALSEYLLKFKGLLTFGVSSLKYNIVRMDGNRVDNMQDILQLPANFI